MEAKETTLPVDEQPEKVQPSEIKAGDLVLAKHAKKGEVPVRVQIVTETWVHGKLEPRGRTHVGGMGKAGDVVSLRSSRCTFTRIEEDPKP